MTHRQWTLVASLLAVACSGARQATENPSAPSLLASVEHSPGYRSPARYRYHPTRQAPMQAELHLPDGGLLFAGKRGERWLLDPRTHAWSTAASLAPEDLIAVLENDAGYWFVGQSGTTYETREPLGKFFRSSAPLEPLVRVGAAHRSIVGIPADRGLWRSNDGAASFSRVGPPHVEFADVALGASGVGLALAIPEALWLSRDDGATWTALGAKTYGTLGLAADRAGQLRVDTILGPFHFSAQAAQLEPGQSPAPAVDLGPSATPRGPDAAALADGRAIVLGARYLEVVAAPAHPSDYELLQGPLDGKLSAIALPQLKDCAGARIAGFGAFLELSCFRSSSGGGSVPVSFLQSSSSALHFEAEPFTGYATPATFRFAMGQGGSLIASGMCGAPGPGCATGGVFYRRQAPSVQAPTPQAPSKTPGRDKKEPRTRFELFAAATPGLAESALGLTFSLDGRTAYALGRRSKTGSLAIFVSHDGGQSFEVRDLDLVRADSDDEDQYWDHSQAVVRLESFSPAEDGSIGAVLADRHGRSLIVADEQGRLLSASKPPEDDALVAAVGSRAFALAPKSRLSWESLDGGVSWQSLPHFPVALCPTQGDCDVKLRCSALGCVIGNEVSRIGWSGQSEEESEALPPASRERTPLVERKIRAPIACALDESAWQTLPFVSSLPTASDAAFGKLSFVAIAFDPTHAAVATVHGFGGPRPHVEALPLLPALNDAANYATVVLDQVEGAAALRYRLPDESVKDRHLRNVEVAWDNALSGQLVRTRLADGGPVAPEDFELGDGTQRAAPDLLSIGEGGLYVRLHHTAADAQDTWYFDGHGSTRIPAIQWPVAGNLRGRTEMARSENNHVPLMLFGRGGAVARARRAGAGWDFDAETLGLPDPAAFAQIQSGNVGYLGNASGLILQSQSGDGTNASAQFFAFRASGSVMAAPITVPTQADLSDRPSRCSADELATTARVDAMPLPGTRHPLVISDSSDPPRLLLSSSAILYGTPKKPCARAFDGEEVAVSGVAPRHERALLLLDDLEHAFLFRLAADASKRANAVQYRTMKCHFDPNLEVPDDVYAAPGTLVPRAN